MSGDFKALVVNQEGENFTREVKSIDKSFLKHGDVLVKVDYSDLNYKDALILNNGAKLVKEFPHIPGIDFAGTVLEWQCKICKRGWGNTYRVESWRNLLWWLFSISKS